MTTEATSTSTPVATTVEGQPGATPATAASYSFRNASQSGEIPSYDGDEPARATDYANYFCSYAQLYHQKQMLADHQRMAAYHSAILGNAASVFKDKVVMDVGTGSGILAVWAAQAGAKKVYAVEYTDMAKHAQTVMEANNVSDIVTVIQSAVENVELPIEEDGLEVEEDEDGGGEGEDMEEVDSPNKDKKKMKSQRCVDIIISEWMGYFLLRESMLDSVIRARDLFLKKRTGLLFPSHASMYVAPVVDEEEQKLGQREYAAAVSDWQDFCQTTSTVYGVDMTCLTTSFEKEQDEYYLKSSRWTELPPNAVLAEPQCIQTLDLMTCTLQDAKGITANDPQAQFTFQMNGTRLANLVGNSNSSHHHPGTMVSGLAGWFVTDFQSRTDALALQLSTTGQGPPLVEHAAQLSTAPEQGYTHWGQQTFYFPSSIPLLPGEVTTLEGRLELLRTAANARLYNCIITYTASRRKLTKTENDDNRNPLQPDPVGPILMKSGPHTIVYQIP